jgi:hypothetical protein
MSEDTLLVVVHFTGLLLGFWCGGHIARTRPDLLRSFWGL